MPNIESYSNTDNLYAREISEGETIRVRVAQRDAQENYEPSVLSYLKRSVKPGAVVLEVGAHVGIFTVLLARCVGPSGQVYAFEPARRTRDALEDHLVLNRVHRSVRVVPAAVSDHSGLEQFFTCSFSPENTLSPKHIRLPEAEAIETPVLTSSVNCTTFCHALLKLTSKGIFESPSVNQIISVLASRLQLSVRFV